MRTRMSGGVGGGGPRSFPLSRFTERVNARLNVDFFNVLNHPGNPNTLGSTGMLATRNSGQGARTLQLTLRLTW